MVLRVLVVDDEAMIRKLLRQALEDSGHRVAEAENAEAGLGALHAAAYDLVITDIVMPGMNGLELLGIAKRLWPDLPVIVISGGGRFGDDDHLQNALNLGAAATINKPFRLHQVRAAIEQARTAGAEGKTACGRAFAC